MPPASKRPGGGWSLDCLDSLTQRCTPTRCSACGSHQGSSCYGEEETEQVDQLRCQPGRNDFGGAFPFMIRFARVCVALRISLVARQKRHLRFSIFQRRRRPEVKGLLWKYSRHVLKSNQIEREKTLGKNPAVMIGAAERALRPPVDFGLGRALWKTSTCT